MIKRIPINEHIGKPATPIVEVGQEVKRGERIAECNGLSANIHASFSGEIKEIQENYILIDHTQVTDDEFVKIEKDTNYLEMIKAAGIIGAGGAGFPTHIKLDIDLDGGYAIINAAECEPILKHNIEFMEKHPEVVVKGLQYIMDITNASKGYIAIKPKHKQALITLGKIVKDIDSIELKYLPNIYPSGDERVVIRELLDYELEPGELPSKANAVVNNVETVKNIYYAIEEQKPVMTKDITVGGRIKNASDGVTYFDVPIGTTMEELINETGGFQKNYGEIILGGPFTGRPGTLNSVVSKKTGGCLVSMPYPQEQRKVGILECECGAQEDRLSEIANAMGAEVIASEKCKRMVEVGGRHRCEKPGECPGQTEKVLALKKAGAQVILAGSCED